MFFKVISLLIIIFNLTSCSWWGGEDSQKKVLTVSDAKVLGLSSDCVDKISSFFTDYFKGKSEKRDVLEGISCIKSITSKIFEHANEKDVKKGFSRLEINNVLKTIFPLRDNNKLNTNIDLLFLFKRMFVGGRLDGFSRSDKLNFDNALEALQKEMLVSLSNIGFVFYPKGVSLLVRDAGYSQLKKSFKAVDELRALYNGTVTEAEFVKIIDYIFNENSDLKIFIDIVDTSKKFLMGEDQVFTRSEPELFRRIFSLLEMQSRLRSIDFSKGFLVGKSYYDLRNSLTIISKELSDWSKKDSEYKIDVSDLTGLLKRIHKLGFLSDTFSNPVVISQSLKRFLIKIFGTSKYKYDSFKKFELMVRDWKRRQNRIISSFNFSWANGRVDGLNKKSSLLLNEIKSFKVPRFESTPGLPILIKRDGESLSIEEEYFDLSLKHTLYTLIHIFFKAYSLDVKGSKNKSEFNLNLTEIKNVFDDLRPLALEMGFANPHVCNAEKRSFIEADSLTMNGNGDDLLSINEAVEWLGTMISVGSITGHMMSQVKGKCSYPGMKQLGFPFVSRSCIKKELFSKNSLLFNYFPGAYSYLETLSSGSMRDKFQDDLGSIGAWSLGIRLGTKETYNNSFTTVANVCGYKDFPFSRAELSKSVALAFYMENVFFQYDKTGLRSSGGKIDPEGADYILDGEEISNFARDKLASAIENYAKALMNKKNSIFKPDSYKILINKIPRLSEEVLKLDRVGVYEFIQKVTGWIFTSELHPFAKRYCEDVYKTFETGVMYKKEDRLSCLPNKANQ